MTLHPSPGPFGLVWLGLMLAAPAAGAETDRPATLIVRLPADARLLVDGRETKQTGPVRRFHSPPLEASKRYHYTLQWTYQKDSKPVTRKKVVHVRAGEEQEVDLRGDDAGEEVAIEKKPVTPGRKEKTDEPDKRKVPAQPKKTDVIFVATPQDVVDKMLDLAEVTKDDVLYDLGCGNGRIVVTAARKYRCKAVGFDLDPARIKESLDNVKTNEVEKLVTIEKKDIFKVDLKPANVVTMYLLPELNERLLPQLEKMKPGSRIVSHDFAIKGVKPRKKLEIDSKEDNRPHTIYLWVTPLEKE